MPLTGRPTATRTWATACALATEDGRTYRRRGADRRRRAALRPSARRCCDEGEPRMIGYVAHRTIVPMEDVSADVHRDEVVLWSGDGFHIVHYPLRGRHAVQHRRGVPDLDLCRARRRRGLSRRARPHLPRLASVDEGAAGDDGSGAALGDLRPRSDPALEQGPRDAARRRRASDAAIAGAGRLHGDRGRGVSRRDDRAFAAATSPRRSGATRRARYLRTARVQFESRYLWDNFYHLGGIEREVMRRGLGGAHRTGHVRLPGLAL